MSTYQYWKWDNAIPDVLCDYTIASCNWGECETGTVGNNINDETIRKTDVIWKHPLEPISCVLQSFAISANNDGKWNFEIFDFSETQIGKYQDSGHYKWHVDLFFDDKVEKQRKLTAIVLLNDGYEGGEFYLGTEKIEMKKGTLIVFPSFYFHKVDPVTSGARYSATLWALGPDFK